MPLRGSVGHRSKIATGEIVGLRPALRRSSRPSVSKEYRFESRSDVEVEVDRAGLAAVVAASIGSGSGGAGYQPAIGPTISARLGVRASWVVDGFSTLPPWPSGRRKGQELNKRPPVISEPVEALFGRGPTVELNRHSLRPLVEWVEQTLDHTEHLRRHGAHDVRHGATCRRSPRGEWTSTRWSRSTGGFGTPPLRLQTPPSSVMAEQTASTWSASAARVSISRDTVGSEATRPNTPGSARSRFTSARQSPPNAKGDGQIQHDLARTMGRERLTPRCRGGRQPTVDPAGPDRLDQHDPARLADRRRPRGVDLQPRIQPEMCITWKVLLGSVR